MILLFIDIRTLGFMTLINSMTIRRGVRDVVVNDVGGIVIVNIVIVNISKSICRRAKSKYVLESRG